MTTFEDSDEYCPHCDNHFVSSRESKRVRPGGVKRIRSRLSPYAQVVEAKIPHQVVGFESEDLRVDSRSVTGHRIPSSGRSSLVTIRRMVKDEREKQVDTSDIDAFLEQLG